MAQTAPGDTGTDTAYAFTSLDSLVFAVNDWAGLLSARQRIRVGQRLGVLSDAIRTAAAAELVGDDGDTRAAQRALADKKTSRRSARREAKRAAAAAKNPKIADTMAAGSLTGEQVHPLVEADNKTDGAAATNDELIDELAATSADATGKVIDDFVTDNADSDSVQAEHDRQRRLRNVCKHKGRFGLGAITIEGDEPSVDAIYKQIRADANRLYSLDGGRDLPAGTHPRTNDQRLFDAVWARLTGNAEAINTVDDDGNPIAAETNTESVPAGSELRQPIHSRRFTPAATRRPTVVIVASLDKLLTGDPNLLADQIGVGPIADSVLAGYLANTEVGVDLIGAVFGVDGQPLWLGRRARYASDAQYLALIVRDKGCVLCNAGYDQCQAHHLTPWHAPAAGRTNIDKLALLCDTCHHQLHDNNLTLYQDRNTTKWQTRPATTAETPPPPPTRRPKPRQTRPASDTTSPTSTATSAKPGRDRAA